MIRSKIFFLFFFSFFFSQAVYSQMDLENDGLFQKVGKLLYQRRSSILFLASTRHTPPLFKKKRVFLFTF